MLYMLGIKRNTDALNACLPHIITHFYFKYIYYDASFQFLEIISEIVSGLTTNNKKTITSCSELGK